MRARRVFLGQKGANKKRERAGLTGYEKEKRIELEKGEKGFEETRIYRIGGRGDGTRRTKQAVLAELESHR